jgi:hypothetical protein
MPAGWVFHVMPVSGYLIGVNAALRHRIVRVSIRAMPFGLLDNFHLHIDFDSSVETA